MLAFPKSISKPAADPVASFNAGRITPKSAEAAPLKASFASVLGKSTSASGDGASGAQATAADATTTSSASNVASTLGDSADSAERFLTLLVAQMRNQDPLNPLDNAQVTTQLAQINTVQGIGQLNDHMKTLIAQNGSGGLFEQASLVGRSILVEGDTLSLPAESGEASAGFRLDGDAKSVQVEVFGSGSDPVRVMSLGAFGAGSNVFSWDGLDSRGERLDEGRYRFRVTAAGASGEIAATALESQRVSGVTRTGDGFQVRTATGASVSSEKIFGVM
ncbi:MAG: flagellar hook capping FlgD N-terminal domain-containing protein [Burkholderiaceae bacterium]